MKKSIVVIFIAFCFLSISTAQDYNTGIGLRAGFSNGVTIKHFISEKSALEGILSSRWRGVQLTGLYEVHNQAFEIERLKWFIGFGAHVGFWNGNYTQKYWGEPNQNYTVIGLDGIIGLEYSFAEVPISLSVDWKPVFNIAGYTGFWADGGALSIRYIF